MTEPHETVIEAVPVRIIGISESEAPASGKASFSTYNLAGTEAAFRILNRQCNRQTAHIAVTTGAAGHVLIGKQEQVQNGQGYFLGSMESVDYTAEPEVWCVPLGDGAVRINVLDEWNSPR